MLAPYGQAFRYADICGEGSPYCTAESLSKNEDVVGNYHSAVQSGTEPMPFVLYVPEGFCTAMDIDLPNVRETADRERIFSVEFEDRGSWKELDLKNMP